jgi:hypothetical protein
VGRRRVIANLFISADGFGADRPEEATWITDEFGDEIQRSAASTSPVCD